MAFSLPVSAQKITVDYDKKVNFSRFTTYTWATGTPVSNPPLDLYIVGAIDLNLQRKGLSRVGTEDADLVVTYHAASSTELNISGIGNPTLSTTKGYNSIDTAGWSIPSTAGSVARQVKKGTLAVQMFDRKKKELVWAAQAKGTIKESRKERLDQLDRALTRMIDQYPPKAK
ncbi:MAG TPA: DUF4136 domain-containing protein [Terriglobales bacterium]|nr:DUF4136 domain-containing protein [Terriglobales bacterium]